MPPDSPPPLSDTSDKSEPVSDHDLYVNDKPFASPRDFGFGVRADRPPPTMRPLVEGLRFNHFKHGGVFDLKAKQSLIQDLHLCLSGWEDLFGIPLESEWYANSEMKKHGYSFHKVELIRNGETTPRIFSVRDMQLRDEYIRQTRGKENGTTVAPLPRRRFGRKCGKVIGRMEQFYTCKTCFRDIASLICADCFLHGHHEGHDVSFKTNYNFSPVCDCGAMDMYKDPELHSCLDHPPITDTNQAPEPKWEAGRTDSTQIPDAFKQALYDCFVVCIEYIIMTFSCAPPHDQLNRLPKDLKEMTTTWGMQCTQVQEPHFREEGPWAVCIFGDERHNTPELDRQLLHATGVWYEDCRDWIRELETVGRKVIQPGAKPTLAFFQANMFEQIDVGISLRHSYDMYMESTAETLLEWMADICQCHVGGDPDLTTNIMTQVLKEERHPVSPHHRIAPDLRRLNRPSQRAGKGYQQRVKNRLDWLWHLDTRFWKRPKLLLRQIYSKIATIHPTSREYLMHRFASNYVRIAQDFLVSERESDSSLYQFLSYSIFSHGDTVAKACKHQQLLTTMVEVLEAWYRNVPGDYRDVLPLGPLPDLDRDERQYNLRMIGTRNKRGVYLLAHLRTVLMLEDVASFVAQDKTLIFRLAQFTDLFIGIQPHQHHIHDHINFEAEWYKGFGLMSELAKLLRQLGQCYRMADPKTIADLMSYLVYRIAGDMEMRTDVLDKEVYSVPKFREIPDPFEMLSYIDPTKRGITHYNLVDAKAKGIKTFTFHHYNHYLFAEMTKSLVYVLGQCGEHVDFPKLLRGIIGSDKEYCLTSAGARLGIEDTQQQLGLLVAEDSLMKYVVIRHIRDERWVRNGHSIRHQLTAYTDSQRRETTFDQEFFLLQTALCWMGPRLFLTAALDRFDIVHEMSFATLEHWVRRSNIKQAITNFEDFLWFLIFLVQDTDAVMQSDMETTSARIIMQMLAIKPMTYSELYKRLSDRVNESLETPKILNEIADLRSATETQPGVYHLKAKYTDHINPLWRNYSRNDRKMVMENLMKKKFEAREDRSLKLEDMFHVPFRPDIPPDPEPFSNLADFLSDPISVTIVRIALGHCALMWSDVSASRLVGDPSGFPQFDQLLDLTLWFAMMVIHEHPAQFVQLSMIDREGIKRTKCPTTPEPDHTLQQTLWLMETTESSRLKGFKPKIKYITSIMRDYMTEEERALCDEGLQDRNLRGTVTTASGNSTAKPSAASRQKQLMAEFAKSQAAFAANIDFGDEDDDMADEDNGLDDGDKHVTCIVCQEKIDSTHPGGMLALFQPSRNIRETVQEQKIFEQSLEVPSSLDNAVRKLAYAEYDIQHSNYHNHVTLDAHPNTAYRMGCYVSGCGHYMHEKCADKQADYTRARHHQQLQRNQPENTVRHEIMCPLCRSISNFILPIDFQAVVKPKLKYHDDGTPLSLLEHIRAMSAEGLIHIKDSTKIWQHHADGGQIKGWFSDTPPPRSMWYSRETAMRGNHKMIDRFRFLLRALADSSERIRESKKPLYIPEDVVAYTVSNLEIAQRGLARAPDQATVAEQLLETSRKVIRKMVEQLSLELDGQFGAGFNRAGLRVGLFARFLPDWYRTSALNTCLLVRDPLSIVIECAAIAPDLLHPIIIMAYYAEVARVLIAVTIMARRITQLWRSTPTDVTVLFPERNREDSDGEGGPPGRPKVAPDPALKRFSNFMPTAIALFRNATPYNDVDVVLKSVPDRVIAKLLYMYTLPFVRRAAIVYYSIHGSYPVTRPEDIVTEGCEYDRLASLLNLPDPRVTLVDSNTLEMPMVIRWLGQWAASGRVVMKLEAAGPYELLSLPKYFDEMVIHYQKSLCYECSTIPLHPGICLFCGKIVCIAGDCCMDGEDNGEANQHMKQCGAALGMFVDVKRCFLLLLYAGNGTYINMPYLDVHGDTDGGGQKRGHRLMLNEQRFDEIRKNIWLNHSIPHLIARKLEGVSDPGGWAAL